MIEIDGSYGEGGGQIVRTALALSTLLQKPFRVYGIRSGRKESGLKNQHLHCIRALELLCGAKSSGAFVGSPELVYEPGKIVGKKLDIDIGTAGSITLMLQSLLLPCFFADKKTTLRIKGGTNVRWSVPFEYFQELIVPHISKFCSSISARLLRRGYYPAGGGIVEVGIRPKFSIYDFDDFGEFRNALAQARINLCEQRALLCVKGVSHASKHLESAGVAERQAHSAQRVLSELNCPVQIRSEYCDASSPGSGITLWAVFSDEDNEIDLLNPVRIGADCLGERGLPAEEVGALAARKLLEEIGSGAPVDRHLADNLVPWMALSGGRMRVSRLTPHLLTNIYVVERFLGKIFSVDEKERIVSSE